jgi:hypothetical protein
MDNTNLRKVELMFIINKLDIIEEDIRQYEHALLDILLFDRTTRKNIIWATDNYAELGEQYYYACEITRELITGVNAKLIQPRISKSLEEQDSRTREKAEVFTPCWVCNSQNNLVDEHWFGRPGGFNTESERSWIVNKSRVDFPEGKSHTWQKYVDTKRLEISCGEAPYLVSRYDAVSGEEIPIESRIGLLDRKLRVVNENTDNEKDWFSWTIRAFQSVYGYECQGDSLLLARENLLITYIEYYQERFNKRPEKEQLLKIARIISWNLWQMDGLKYVVPHSCQPKVTETFTLFGTERTEEPCPGCKEGDIYSHTGVYCKVFDWREKASLSFISMVKGAKS